MVFQQDGLREDDWTNRDEEQRNGAALFVRGFGDVKSAMERRKRGTLKRGKGGHVGKSKAKAGDRNWAFGGAQEGYESTA